MCAVTYSQFLPKSERRYLIELRSDPSNVLTESLAWNSAQSSHSSTLATRTYCVRLYAWTIGNLRENPENSGCSS